MADSFDKHVEVQHLNKPFFIQLKRVWRFVKKVPNKEKSKKLGFYLQGIRKIKGSAQTNEKIVKDIFGKSQEMSPNKFIERIFEFQVPEGKKLYVKPETGYQTTQRLVPSEKLNKTIQISVFGDIYDKILKKYEGRPDGDDIIRNVNKHLSSHFANAAGFIRWTKMSPTWIHIDALQTDFFSALKRMKFEEKETEEVVNDFRKYEDEFFKTAFSYVVRSNPKIKVWTMNTEDMIKAIERVSERSGVKLKKYYHQLPKAFGFKLISMDRLAKIFQTRPGAKTEKLLSKFKGALSKVKGDDQGEFEKSEVVRMALNIATSIDTHYQTAKKKKVAIVDAQHIDQTIQAYFSPGEERYASAFHQYINPILKILKSQDYRRDLLRDFLRSKVNAVLEMVSKKGTGFGNVWWADRKMLFENVIEREPLTEEIKRLAGI